jgi:hypothetical protein
LQAVASVDLDTALYRALRGLVGIEERPARLFVDSLRDHRVGGRWRLVHPEDGERLAAEQPPEPGPPAEGPGEA